MTQLCFGCMRQKLNRPVCEFCGFDERMENQSHQLPIGTILQNQYLVGRVLGQGGFGITYIGWDQHLSIPVAIKEYYPSGVVQRHTQLGNNVICANGEAPELFEKHKTRFLKEARTLAQLSGIPEIVQIKSFFPENGTAYIVMEYVEGITLKDHLKRLGRPMTEGEALTIMEPVLKALQKVHDHGLIHRDISPDNIMLPKSGGIKLIDFGTVRYMDDSGKSKSTEAVLKPGFAPMEQYNSRGNLGTWTDVYAICATFHYLLTGKVPADVHDRMEQGESLKLLRSRSGISQKLIYALEKGMKLRIQERIQTTAELYQQLYSGKKKPAVPKQQEIKKPVSEKKTKKKGKGGILAACAAAAVAVGVAAMLLILKERTPQAQLAVPETSAAPSQDTTIPTTLPPETTEVVTAESIAYAEAEALSAQGMHARAGIAFARLGDYRDSRERSFKEWSHVRQKRTISYGSTFYADYGIPYLMGLKQDGTAVLTGPSYEQCQSVADWTDLVGVYVAGESVPLAVKADGTVLFGPPIILVPDLFRYDMEYFEQQVSQWTDIVALFDSGSSVYGLKRDGTLVFASFTGNEEYDREINAELSEYTNIVDCLPSYNLEVLLRADGTVISRYRDSKLAEEIAKWENVVRLCQANGLVLGICADGSVNAAGSYYDYSNQETREFFGKVDGLADVVDICDSFVLRSDGTVALFAPAGEPSPYFNRWKDTIAEWTDVVSFLSLGNLYALRSDGTMVVAGQGYEAETVAKWTDIAYITRTYDGILGIKYDGSVVMCGESNTLARQWTNIQIP